MELHVIGANATAPTRHGGASCYVVRSETGVVMVDAGPGSLLSYCQQSCELDDLRAIILTHLHADHSLDMMAWAYRWTFPTVQERIPLYVPAGEADRLAQFDALYAIPTTARRPGSAPGRPLAGRSPLRCPV